MYEAYERIFTRCGLRFRAVLADTGAIGGSESHEFMVLAETGEDRLALCEACGYAANVELAEGQAYFVYPQEEEKPLEKVSTPGVRSVEEVSAFLGVPPSKLVKTLLYRAGEEVVAVLIRGDLELNEVKLRNLLGVAEVEMADPETVERITRAPVGFAGPVGLSGVRVLADLSVRGLRNFVTGANEVEAHYVNVNYGRDFPEPEFHDLRVVTEGDPCPRCGRLLAITRGIEVGHIFKLGTKYSRPMRATFLDREGQERPLVMGCYGIGIGRTVAAAIEQNHDEAGIVFPREIAPFEALILTLGPDPDLLEASERLYRELSGAGIEVLWDDRDERPGVKFKDADLIGLPYQVIVGRRFRETGEVELKERATGRRETLSPEALPSRLKT